MNELNEVLERTGCAEELVKRPESWEQLMTAVASGAIDYDDLDEVASECSALADSVHGSTEWQDAVAGVLDDFAGEWSSDSAQTLIACGRAADDAALTAAPGACLSPLSPPGSIGTSVR